MCVCCFFSQLGIKAINNSVFYFTLRRFAKNIWIVFWWLKRTIKKVFELLRKTIQFLQPFYSTLFRFELCKFLCVVICIISLSLFLFVALVVPGFGLCPGWDLLMRGAALCFVMHSSEFLLWFVGVFFKRQKTCCTLCNNRYFCFTMCYAYIP